MRRFLLTYTREGHSMEVEGVVFSTGGVALEPYPDDEYPCPRGFVTFASMEYSINEFGDTSVKWLDEEVAPC